MSITSETAENDQWLDTDFNSVVRNVKAILEEHPAAREKDNLLVSLYWTIFDNLSRMPITEISKATPAEHIRRARQYIQSPKGLGILGPSIKILAARSRAERGFRHRFARKKPEDTTLEVPAK